MKHVIILGSGPSMCVDDARFSLATGWTVIAVNSTWEIAPECDVIYAGDFEWWQYHIDGINSAASRWTCNQKAAQMYGLGFHQVKPGPYNSGLRAIEFAAYQGARRILLVGFDCSLKYGNHWHSDHPYSLNPTNSRVALWHKQFAFLAKKLSAQVEIINCSRYSALDCFRRGELYDAVLK